MFQVAKDIEATPTLEGRDAEEFLKSLDVKYSQKKEDFLKRAEKAYEKYIKKARD